MSPFLHMLIDNSVLTDCIHFDIKAKSRWEVWVTDLGFTRYRNETIIIEEIVKITQKQM